LRKKQNKNTPLRESEKGDSMKLREYLANLNAMVKNNEKLLDCAVVTSSDDEGNEYNEVNFTPSAGIMEGGSFDNSNNGPDDIPTTVCLN
jgi:uncharacterized protein YnzC (UPF0291/DUF896 family)